VSEHGAVSDAHSGGVVVFGEKMFTDKQIGLFWKNVNVRHSSECWDWKLSLDRDGYGKVKIAQRVYVAHRVAFALGRWVEIPPRDVEVRHSCDNRKCCNPRHLVIGSHSDNMQDMISRGRRIVTGFVGKMNREKVLQLKDDFKNGTPKRALGKKYNISTRSVRDILKGLYWK
jgi:hypothetical protein